MIGPFGDADPVAWLAAGLVTLGAVVLCSRAAAVAAPALARRIRGHRPAGRPRRRGDDGTAVLRPRQGTAGRHRWFPGLLALVGLAATTPGAAAHEGPDRSVDEAGNDAAGQAVDAGASTMRLERPGPPARTWLPRATSDEGPSAVDAPPVAIPIPIAAPVPDPEPAAVWTVRPGDHLWAIAEDVVAGQVGRPPTDAEVAPYWRSLVEANRDRLVDRSNADLILPGQELVLPPS